MPLRFLVDNGFLAQSLFTELRSSERGPKGATAEDQLLALPLKPKERAGGRMEPAWIRDQNYGPEALMSLSSLSFSFRFYASFLY